VSRRLQENLIAVFILLIFVAAIVASLDYSPRARLVPIPIAAIGIVFIVGQIILQNLKSEDNLHVDLLEFLTKPGEKADPAFAVDAGAPGTAAPKRGTTPVSEVQAFGIVALLVAVFVVFGPMPAMFLFSAGYFIASRHYAVVKGIAYSAFYTIAVYLVFSTGLKVQLDRNLLGIRFDMIGRWIGQLFS
jgi:hypothetical protein